MTPIRMMVPVPPGEDMQPGDLWRVAAMDRAAGIVTLARCEAAPDQYRSPRDGLHPRFQLDTRPISKEEATLLAEKMEAAMDAHGRHFRDVARAQNEQLAAALQAELAAVEGPDLRPEPPSPFSDLDCEG